MAWPGLQRLGWVSEPESLTGVESELGSLASAYFGLESALWSPGNSPSLSWGGEGMKRKGRDLPRLCLMYVAALNALGLPTLLQGPLQQLSHKKRGRALLWLRVWRA